MTPTLNSTDVLATRQSLLSRMRNLDDEASWKRFFDTYWRLLYNVARHAGLTENEAQDTVQETVIAVARKIPEFQYDPAIGSFRGWLMRITYHKIAHVHSKKRYQREGKQVPREESLSTSLLETLPDLDGKNLEEAWNQEWERHLLETALDKVRRKVSPMQYQMFDMHVFKEMPARTVAQRLGVKMTEVYLAKYKIWALIKRETKALERQMV
jgi:RNA polymerase sigma factor (sigma-70 family)